MCFYAGRDTGKDNGSDGRDAACKVDVLFISSDLVRWLWEWGRDGIPSQYYTSKSIDSICLRVK